MRRPLSLRKWIVTTAIAMAVGLGLWSLWGYTRQQGALEAYNQFLKDNSKTFDDSLPELLAAIRDSDSILIYEGLPHQYLEEELLKSEIASKQTVKIGDFHFYSPALLPKTSQHDDSLREILSSTKSYLKLEGPKMCDGYHPDWAVEFANGADKVQVLLCFGCAETRIDHGKMRILIDLHPRKMAHLKYILSHYQAQRPPSVHH